LIRVCAHSGCGLVLSVGMRARGLLLEVLIRVCGPRV
jgi:hypothetical protein